MNVMFCFSNNTDRSYTMPNPVGFSTPVGHFSQPVPNILLSPIVHETGNVT